MFCKNCGESLNENQAICLKCGVAVGRGSSYCSNCGKDVNPETPYCMGCGFALNPDEGSGKASDGGKEQGAAGNLGGHDKTTMALVCFFLGAIGIHNFMMGEKKRGIGKIIMYFLCGISGILALIDFIKILSGTYVIDTEKMF